MCMIVTVARATNPASGAAINDYLLDSVEVEKIRTSESHSLRQRLSILFKTNDIAP
jgi:hypothetical protein